MTAVGAINDRVTSFRGKPRRLRRIAGLTAGAVRAKRLSTGASGRLAAARGALKARPRDA